MVIIVIRRRGEDEESKSVFRNYQIITALQTQVEDRLSVRPGVYDGRKNLFTSFDLEFESGAHEVSLSRHHSSFIPLLNSFPVSSM
jgi:hypothetical protein